MKKEMLAKYQLIISDFYSIPIRSVTELVPNFFDNGKYLLHYENFQLYLRIGLNLKKC